MHLISSEPSSVLILLFFSAAFTNDVYFLFLKFLPLASTRLDHNSSAQLCDCTTPSWFQNNCVFWLAIIA